MSLFRLRTPLNTLLLIAIPQGPSPPSPLKLMPNKFTNKVGNTCTMAIYPNSGGKPFIRSACQGNNGQTYNYGLGVFSNLSFSIVTLKLSSITCQIFRNKFP